MRTDFNQTLVATASDSYDHSLLGQVGRIVAPERDTIAKFFLAMDEDIRNRGFFLSVHRDFRDFKKISLELGKTLFPAFDPAFHQLDSEQSFWLALRQGGPTGPLVGIQGGKLQLLGDRTLGDYIATGRFFYTDPLEQMESGERFIIQGEADVFASKVMERVAYSGGTTICPEWRGRTNLARVLPLISHTLGYSRWYVDWVISMVDQGIHDSVVTQRYAHTNDCGGLEWFRPRMPNRRKWWIIAKRAEDVVTQAGAYLDQPVKERLRIG